MEKDIREILENTKNGDKVISYIKELEEHIMHHHHHDENCDCGCHDHDEEEEWEEIKTPYKNNLTVKDWEKLLKDENIFTKDSLTLMKRMRHIAAPTSPIELADMFGFGAMYYKNEVDKLEQRLIEKLKINKLDKNYYWAIIFDCWKNKKTEEQIYALKTELYEAIGNTDFSNIPLRENSLI